MMSLPTKQSSGRANLHQGAIGVGIELGSGVTRGGVAGSGRVDTHPDTGGVISGIAIPRWTEMLSIACRAADMLSLQYFGIDIVLDKDRGPLLLEVNVRPGLAIQLANRVGLRNRLDLIDRHAERLENPEDRMDFAMRKVAGVSRLL
jgi:glutathione synthase/RimK-type ligase-like ATP-grasp enzyme